MKLAEMLNAAKENGYGVLDDGQREWELDEFGQTFRGDRGDWSFEASGRIIEHGPDGYQSGSRFRLRRDHA